MSGSPADPVLADPVLADPVLAGTEAIAAVAAGALSVSDVVEGCLGRVAELDSVIGAFRLVDEHGARGRAKELDEHVAGPLQGLVAGVKDVIDTAGLPTGYGSGLFADHQPAADADVVTALRQAGAIVLGKTESTEFAMFAPARTRNPVDPARTPGGSSSGSAAAVAAGMVPVALGTQTAGSVVRPAAYCGVYGFKPAWGWTSTKGIWRLSGHLDTVGLFARRVSDLLLTYQALRSPGEQARSPCGPAAAAHPPGKPSVAVLSGQEWADCDGDVRDALSWVAGLALGRRLGGPGDGHARLLAAPARTAGGRHGGRGGGKPARGPRRPGQPDIRERPGHRRAGRPLPGRRVPRRARG